MQNTIRIGRAGDNDVVINQPVVSGHHAEVTMNGPGVFSIVDVGSTNGTYVNGNRIRSAQVSLQDKVFFHVQPFILYVVYLLHYEIASRYCETFSEVTRSCSHLVRI